MSTPARPPSTATEARMRAPAGDIPALTWQGAPIDCTTCPHRSLREQAGCEPGHACMQDGYARRIDRFFRWHKALAAQHLRHPYFEVRAIAARYAEVFHLPALMHDPDETVRLQVALRLPQRLLAQMRQDEHREARIRVAAEWKRPDLLAVIELVEQGRLSLDGLITGMESPDRARQAYEGAVGDPHCLKMVLDWGH